MGFGWCLEMPMEPPQEKTIMTRIFSSTHPMATRAISVELQERILPVALEATSGVLMKQRSRSQSIRLELTPLHLQMELDAPLQTRCM